MAGRAPLPARSRPRSLAARRYGLARAVDTGGALAGPVPSNLTARVARAVELYEAFAEYRPRGWPASGAGAFCVLASQHRADVLMGDVARLRTWDHWSRVMSRDPGFA
jgi:hypothetical protein